jgi:hypothetical protein
MDSIHFGRKAALCRRLADLLPLGDPTRVKLLKLAEEYETAAEELENIDDRHPREQASQKKSPAAEGQRRH